MRTIKPMKRQSHICIRCNSQDVLVRHKSDVLDFKGLTLEVDGLAETVCQSCGLAWTTEGQDQDNLNVLRAGFAQKRDAVRDKEGLLTGEQINEVLEVLQITKAEAAALFGGGPHAFSKYISGEVLQSLPMDRLLRLTLAVGNQAVRYLRQGKQAPMALNAVGYFVAPPVPTTEVLASANQQEHASVRMAHTSPTALAYESND